MIMQDLSEEQLSGVRQSAISDMDVCPSHSGGLSYCSHWDGVDRAFIRPHNLPYCFQPVGAPVDRFIDPVSMRHKEDGFAGFGHLPGHGLSLRLGPELEPNNSRPYNCNQAHILENVARNKTVYGGVISRSCGKHPRDDCMICDGDIVSSSYTFGFSNTKFHDLIIDVLQKSPYLKEAQQLLNEVVCVSNSALEPSSCKNVLRKNPIKGNMWATNSSKEKHEMCRMARLVTLQEELENHHNQYFHQMDELVSSFEAVGGVGSAAAYTTLTSQAMSKHFSNLGEAIITHIESLREAFSKDVPRNHKQVESLQHLGMIRVRQIWRPLRGLPEDSVMVLRAWLFEHFLHPYPNDNEKLLLASKTGLTRNQISNWFINARVRLWKPMIEEMYREEFEEGEEDSNPT
ncbi:BEL1-like homeodomain protein 11 [Platanthera guangdongensis]|uniref:BEL1-like homeodomain protein 11 n=1 Tax=Platanthera guangdongensis TaxID=2320717 RepID=A0ABR2MGC8_9ASPA